MKTWTRELFVIYCITICWILLYYMMFRDLSGLIISKNCDACVAAVDVEWSCTALVRPCTIVVPASDSGVDVGMSIDSRFKRAELVSSLCTVSTTGPQLVAINVWQRRAHCWFIHANRMAIIMIYMKATSISLSIVIHGPHSGSHYRFFLNSRLSLL